MLIAGDIGGTKTLLAIYDPRERASTPVRQMEYRSADYTALGAMVREFLAASRCVVRAACFDVAVLSTGGVYLAGGIPRRVLPTKQRAWPSSKPHSKQRMGPGTIVSIRGSTR